MPGADPGFFAGVGPNSGDAALHSKKSGVTVTPINRVTFSAHNQFIVFPRFDTSLRC